MLIFLILLFAGHPFTGSCLGGGKYLMPFAGSNATLTCMLPDKGDMLYWYKHTVGEKPTLVATKYNFDSHGMFYDGFKDSSRFQLSSNYHLNISNLQASDTATYYCATIKHYMLKFSESTSVVVQAGGVADIRTEVRQSAATGDAVILKCSVHVGSCDRRPRVHWFKQPGGSAPGVLYSQGGGGGGGGEQCESKADGPANSCIYSLPMNNVSSEQAGNYYCAVAACGYLLFGKATTLNVSRLNAECDCEPVATTEDREDREDRGGVVIGEGTDEYPDSLQIYVLSGALAFTSVLVVILALVIGVLNRRNHTDSYVVSTSYKTMAETFKKGDVLYYVAVEQMKSGRSKKHQDDTWSECAYFNVN